MSRQIALFNHKGGVSKTTTTFNLGWQLAVLGKRVVLVDADPQSNLTGLVLGYCGPSDLEDFYRNEPDRNLKSGLAPAFESRPERIKPVECFPIPGRDGLFLLPGHIGLSEFEVTLGIAQELSGSIQTLQNLPGSIPHLLNETAKKFNADYILIDMNPSLSSFNQNLLVTSDYFIVPTTPDYYSVMAIDSLTKVIPNWDKWSDKAQQLPILKEASYPFPHAKSKFLGIIVQNYRPRSGAPTRGFQQWIDRINVKVTQDLYPALKSHNMTLPDSAYGLLKMDNYCLASIPDFNSLITISQEKQTPVYALTDEQLRQSGQRGPVLSQTKESQAKFGKIFLDLGNKVLQLTSYANGN
ncbi:MAG: ParA family protein [Synechococcus sp. SB0678_bin_12]|nr:ParA family protein [Synechococcus sp. SB0678_bin_12]